MTYFYHGVHIVAQECSWKIRRAGEVDVGSREASWSAKIRPRSWTCFTEPTFLYGASTINTSAVKEGGGDPLPSSCRRSGGEYESFNFSPCNQWRLYFDKQTVRRALLIRFVCSWKLVNSQLSSGHTDFFPREHSGRPPLGKNCSSNLAMENPLGKLCVKCWRGCVYPAISLTIGKGQRRIAAVWDVERKGWSHNQDNCYDQSIQLLWSINTSLTEFERLLLASWDDQFQL